MLPLPRKSRLINVLQLSVGILPEPCIEFPLEILIRGIQLFSVGVPSYDLCSQLPPFLSILGESSDTEDYLMGVVLEVSVEHVKVQFAL